MCKSPRVSSVSPTSASTADVPAKEINAPSADDPSAKAPVKTSKPLSCTQLGRMVCRGVLLLALGAAFILTTATLFQLLGDDDDHDGHDDKDDNDKRGLLWAISIFLLRAISIFLLTLGWLLVWFLMCVATIQCLRSPEDVAAGRERIERKLENLVELNFYKRLPQSDRNFMMDKHYMLECLSSKGTTTTRVRRIDSWEVDLDLWRRMSWGIGQVVEARGHRAGAGVL